MDRTVKNNCRRCWVSQKYCATGEGMDKRCQWPNVVVPLAYAARLRYMRNLIQPSLYLSANQNYSCHQTASARTGDTSA
jgi:hypothetical protein